MEEELGRLLIQFPLGFPLPLAALLVGVGVKMPRYKYTFYFEWSKRGCEATELSFFERSEKKRSSMSEFFFDS